MEPLTNVCAEGGGREGGRKEGGVGRRREGGGGRREDGGGRREEGGGGWRGERGRGRGIPCHYNNNYYYKNAQILKCFFSIIKIIIHCSALDVYICFLSTCIIYFPSICTMHMHCRYTYHYTTSGIDYFSRIS